MDDGVFRLYVAVLAGNILARILFFGSGGLLAYLLRTVQIWDPEIPRR